ncbi:hypothetical protein [Marinicella sp. W31]|uniref:hypothetical protein n=1 Tax=Marinicella sp. W31 TaxID=3023713 RepID=UPI003756B26A
MKIKKLLELPISSSGCANVKVIASSAELLVIYGFNSRKDSSKLIGQILFDSVISYSFRNTMHSRGYADGSYDSLVEIESSDWMKWLLEIEPPMIGNTVAGKKHFAVFFSENGYLEVVADSYKVLPYEEGRLNYPEFEEYID